MGFELLPEERTGSGRLDGRRILLLAQLEHRSGNPLSPALRDSTPRPSRAPLLRTVGVQSDRPDQEVWVCVPTETGIHSRRYCWKKGGTRYKSICSWRAETSPALLIWTLPGFLDPDPDKFSLGGPENFVGWKRGPLIEGFSFLELQLPFWGYANKSRYYFPKYLGICHTQIPTELGEPSPQVEAAFAAKQHTHSTQLLSGGRCSCSVPFFGSPNHNTALSWINFFPLQPEMRSPYLGK